MKPTIRWHPLFKCWVCYIEKQWPIRGFGIGNCPEAAYKAWKDCQG